MRPYIPVELPIQDLDFRRLIPAVGTANAELARYDGLLQGIVNPAILLSPLTVEEAVLSSRLEGTQATMDDVYEHEAGIEKTEDKTRDIQEAINHGNSSTAERGRDPDRIASCQWEKTRHFSFSIAS